ncbi:hypothetical protein M0804_012432 [Polistes exclamans]|nr:hypothetical protein M0804_012432 [Polistes exclamans]
MKGPAIKHLESFVSEAAGLIIKFDPSCIEFMAWEMKFNSIMRKVELPSDMKVPFLLKLIEPYVLTEIEKRRCITLTELSNSSYQELVHILQDTFKDVEQFELSRITFRNRKQKEGESVVGFFNTLKMISISCNFPTRFIDATLKIQFSNGIRNQLIQRVLWRVLPLRSEQLLSIAKEMELHDRLTAMGVYYPYPSVLYELLY